MSSTPTRSSAQESGWSEIVPGYRVLRAPIDQRKAFYRMKARIEETEQEAGRLAPPGPIPERGNRSIFEFLRS